ncbi:hypothetical protein FQN51_006124 [Onygenales sp. PD_10]|nr:hypothetical protein FQN51_006124 [Onygenales sp. PD_10]
MPPKQEIKPSSDYPRTTAVTWIRIPRLQKTALGYAAADGHGELVDALLRRDDVDVNLGSLAPVYLATTSWAGGEGLRKLLAVAGVDVTASR